MNAITTPGATGLLARFEGLKTQLPGDPAVRSAAAEMFRANGIPGGTSGRRAEAWKYTTLRAVAEASFHEPLTGLDDCAALMARLPQLDAARLVFVDGRFRADLSVLPAGFAVGSFAAQPDFGTLSRPDRDNLVALNSMLAEDGAVIAVPDGVDGGTLQILSLAAGGHGRATAFHPRHAIRLGRGSSLRLLEISAGAGSYLHNAVTEVHVGEDAHLAHVRLQDEAAGAFHVSTAYVEIAARGTYDGFTLNLGAKLARSETHARLGGAGAALHLNGAQLLSGSQHADMTTVVSHDAPGCASRQTVKNVLAGRSRGVFQGKIEVARIAQKTDGYQMNQALLLSREAEIDCKPELEIFADDVKCSHGATVGELDRGQIVDLRSRGVPAPEARAMRVRAFLTEALDAVGEASFRTALESAVTQWWEREAA